MAVFYEIGTVLWVLKLRDSARDEDTATGDWFYKEGDAFELTDDVNKAECYEDKDAEIAFMKSHERRTKERWGDDAICNYGYTNMMRNFEFVEVEVYGHKEVR